MKLIIAYLTYSDPAVLESLKDKIESLSFCDLGGYGKSSGGRQVGVRVEKYCEDNEVDAIIASIRECNTWEPPAQASEEFKQELLGQGYAEDEIKSYDPVRPNGEDLGKIIVLPMDGVYSVREKDA